MKPGAGALLRGAALTAVIGVAVGPRGSAQAPARNTPAVGSCRLNGEVGAIAGLHEMTTEEVNAMRPPTRFEGERYYRAPAAVFAGVTWDMIVAAVRGRVFKISGLFTPRSEGDLEVRWRQMGAALRTALGPPKVFQDGTVLLWDMADGNLLLHRERGGFVTLLLMSWATQGFTRMK